MKQELVNQEQELESSDQRLSESKFEIEELKNLLQEQVVQVENYRNKVRCGDKIKVENLMTLSWKIAFYYNISNYCSTCRHNSCMKNSDGN